MMELSQYSVNPVSKGSPRSWPASNELVRSVSPYYNANVVYGRTGFADDRYSVVAMGSKAGYEYMAVALGAPKTGDGDKAGVHYRDVSRLLGWGFRDFSYKTLLRKNEPVGRIDVGLSWETDAVALGAGRGFFYHCRLGGGCVPGHPGGHEIPGNPDRTGIGKGSGSLGKWNCT